MLTTVSAFDRIGADLDSRPLVVRLRDGVARLAQPYL